MDGEKYRLYSSDDLQPVIEAMARSVYSQIDHASPLWLVGVIRRGAPLADMIASRLTELNPALQIKRLDLQVKRYSDDLHLLHPDTDLQAPALEPDALKGQQVVVIDDVLYQGHSLARVLEFLRGCHADPIRTAVLVDRRVARLPLRADIAGLVLQLAPGDVVECRVPPFEPVFEIDLFRPARD